MNVERLKIFSPLLIPILSSICSLALNPQFGVVFSAVLLVPQVVCGIVFYIAIKGFKNCGVGNEFLRQVMFGKAMKSLIAFLFLALLANAIGFFFVSGLVAFATAIIIFSNSSAVDSMILIKMAKDSGKFNKTQYMFAGGACEARSQQLPRAIGTEGYSSVHDTNGQMVTAFADSDYSATDRDIYWPQHDYHTNSAFDSSPGVNPASGLPMVNDVMDVGGNVYGFGEPTFSNDSFNTNQFSDFDYHNNQ